MSSREAQTIASIDLLPSDVLFEIVNRINLLDWLLQARLVSKSWLQAVSKIKQAPRTDFAIIPQKYHLLRNFIRIFPNMTTAFISIDIPYHESDSLFPYIAGMRLTISEPALGAQYLSDCLRQRTQLRTLKAIDFDKPFDFGHFNEMAEDLEPPPDLRHIRVFAATSVGETKPKFPSVWLQQLNSLSIFFEGEHEKNVEFELDFTAATSLTTFSICVESSMRPHIKFGSTKLQKLELWAGPGPHDAAYWNRLVEENSWSGSSVFDTSLLRSLQKLSFYNFESSFDLAAISWLTQLTCLRVWPVSYVHNPRDVAKLTNLRSLILGHMELQSGDNVTDMRQPIHDLPNLKILKIHSSFMTSLDGARFRSASTLEVLDVFQPTEGIIEAVEKHFLSVHTLRLPWAPFVLMGGGIIPHVTQLQFWGCVEKELTDFNPRVVAKMFPNVRKLLFTQCSIDRRASIVEEFFQIRMESQGAFHIEYIEFDSTIFMFDGRILDTPTHHEYNKLDRFV